MKNPISRPGWVILLLVLFVGACKKNDLNAGADGPAKENLSMVSITLAGRITDIAQEPISGAVVRSGNSIAQTDINGIFNFPGILVNPKAALVEVYKNGYFRSYQTIEVQPSSAQYAEIRLMPISQVEQFNASAGARIALPAGADLEFQPNSMADKVSGQSYTGNIDLAAYTMHAGEPDFLRSLPGTRAISLDKKEKMIQPYTVLITELAGSSGQSLEPLKGRQVKVAFPIAEKDLGSAPATISMWHFDNSYGIWMEEGKAVKNGSKYEGFVQHFSIWACATAVPLISLQANITDRSGNGLSYAKVQLFNATNQQPVSTISRTDGNGYLMMAAHANHALELKVLDECGEAMVSRKINTGNTSNWLGKIIVESYANQSATLQGKVENCKNTGVFSGQVTVQMQGRTFRAPIKDGRFSLLIQRCSGAVATASIVAIDAAGNQESAPRQIKIGTGITDLGTISTCDAGNSQFISYTINGTNYLLQAPGDSVVQSLPGNSGKTSITCYRGTDPSKPAISFSFAGAQKPGQYPVTALVINQDKQAFVPTGNFTIEITNYGLPGEYITGKCVGQVKSPAFNQAVPVSLNFKVLRK